MTVATIKEDAKQLIDQLPDDSSWEDLIHEIYVRQTIEAGLAIIFVEEGGPGGFPGRQRFLSCGLGNFSGH